MNINPCSQCKREAVTLRCVGGWLIHCKYGDAFQCALDNEPWCDHQYDGVLFDTEEEAIKTWNKGA